MAKFAYKFKTAPDMVQSAVIEADSFDQAVSRIMASGQSPLEVVPMTLSGAVAGASAQGRPEAFVSGPVSPLMLCLFMRQLGDLLESRVPVARALDLLSRQIKDPQLKKVAGRLCQCVQEGESLSGAFHEFPRLFSSFHIQMLKCAESSGNLPAVILHLAGLMEANIDLNKRVRMGLTYPLIILAVGAGTILVLLIFVLPRLTAMFDDFNAVLPWPTQVVIAVSGFFAAFWWLVAGVSGSAVYAAVLWWRSPAGRRQADRVVLDVMVLKEFIRQVELVRFARGLGTLIVSGVPVVEAMESAAALIGNSTIRREIDAAVVKVRSGTSVSNALKGTRLFGDIETSLVAVAEESGHFDQGLMKLTSMNERNVRQSAEMFVTIIGPAALVFVVGIVGFIVIAVLLPMLQMNSIVN
jgi:type II secretory pathway component PulF